MFDNIVKKIVLKIPIAHAEGSFYTDDETINSLIKMTKLFLNTVDKDGTVNNELNPNGQLLNTVKICN